MGFGSSVKEKHTEIIEDKARKEEAAIEWRKQREEEMMRMEENTEQARREAGWSKR